jgi:NifU-like protein involved in Fe-S cluster formation
VTAQPLYTGEILRLAAALSEPRLLASEHGRAEVRSPTCGSRIETCVTLEDGRVVALSQEVRACAFGQASATLLEQGAAGRSHNEIEQAQAQLAAWLEGDAATPHWPGIEALAPARSRKGRHGAILLPFRALVAAMSEAG